MIDKNKEQTLRVDQRLKHIAFIMDGNGRWAKKRGMPREFGHTVGAKTFEKVVRYCGDIGIRVVTVYAFSTENWRRSEEEVGAIMRLMEQYLKEAIRDMQKTGKPFLIIINSRNPSGEAPFSPCRGNIRRCWWRHTPP